MSLFFRENSSSLEKIYTIFSLVWMCLSIFGLRHNFKTAHGFSLYVLLLSILVGIALLVPLYFDKHPKNKLQYVQGAVKVKAWTSLLLMSIAFSWASIGLGLPAMYTYLFGEVTSEKVVITRLQGDRRKGCDPRIRIKEYKGTYCVRKSFFETLNEGDEIYVKMRRSGLGHSVLRFSRENI